MQIHDRHFEISISKEQIKRRVEELGNRIDEDYEGKNPLFLTVLNGAFVFAADVFRQVSIPAEISFIKLKSYKKMQSSGKVKELLGLDQSIFNRHIIIVEDIVDTGTTLTHILKEFEDLGACTIEILTLLHKPASTTNPVSLKYVGFEIPNDFVVGYGLDYDRLGRNLNDIYKVKDR